MNVVLTSAELPCDKPRAESPCGRCGACLRAGPIGVVPLRLNEGSPA